MQVVNADAMVVKLNSGEYKTIHLSSIRPPRIEGEVQTNLCVRVCLPACVCTALHTASGHLCVNKWLSVFICGRACGLARPAN